MNDALRRAMATPLKPQAEIRAKKRKSPKAKGEADAPALYHYPRSATYLGEVMPHDDLYVERVEFQRHDYGKVVRLRFYDHEGKMLSVVLSRPDLAKMLTEAKEYI